MKETIGLPVMESIVSSFFRFKAIDDSMLKGTTWELSLPLAIIQSIKVLKFKLRLPYSVIITNTNLDNLTTKIQVFLSKTRIVSS